MMTEDIADTVRRAAAAVPASRSDLSAVLRRHRAHRRRRAALAAVAVVAVVGATAVTGAVVQAGGRQRAVPAVGQATQTAAAWVQRLPLDAGWALTPNQFGAKVTVPDARALLELGADGQLLATPFPAALVDDVRSWVPLDDGRFVMLGGKDLKPGTQRQDGPDVTDYAVRLLVLAPDGKVVQQREVRVQGQDVQLIGATATTAYLYRTPGRIMAHDLATGAEQRVTALDPYLPAWEPYTLVVQRNLLLTASQEPCELTGTALDTGRGVFVARFPDRRGLSCPTLRTARLSPDGRTLAVAVSDGDQAAATVSLLKIDVGTGIVNSFPVSGGPVARDLKPGTLGVGWAGAAVRVAWVRMPAPGVHPLAGSLQVTDVP